MASEIKSGSLRVKIVIKQIINKTLLRTQHSGANYNLTVHHISSVYTS